MEHGESLAQAAPREIYTVSRLNREARALVEGSFPLLWIEGELSNLARPSSGHLYFSLKDPNAQVRCAMFRNRNLHLRFRPADGMQVLVRARISLYEARGEFQLIVEHMEEAGDGALRRAFEQLKERLAAEGLFAAEHKRPVPALPRRIGVITSPSGAAIRDVLSVLRRRFPALPLLIYPVPVQGEGAAQKIAAAIRLADERRDCDVLIVTRGGGSLEDLWAFNEEAVARAIFDCRLPVVSAVGHEVDFTIADLAADYRAPTPSAAAEHVSPDQADWLRALGLKAGRLERGLRGRLGQSAQRLDWLAGRLRRQHPGARLRQHGQRLDELEQRLQRAQRNHVRHLRARLGQAVARLERHIPTGRLHQLDERRASLGRRLDAAMGRHLERRQQRLAALGRALETISPLATLERGYAIVSREADGTILRDTQQTRPGERVQARLSRGVLVCTVDEIKER
ncbi:MAG: exodeoxyribonuclease VII large subunit [Gammaproteobacteria bacterium]|nr:exodeoxyribonuclease VII large subunit [Gammaproteobacteria bacterium]NIR97890.1 exodeoxyribonuclease VII large subunit [Gammaproteobacteria bacterium]NIT63595.1 exodeoxyribonuclease VII large subunit [Gammaproteobacteria bacterium]NIV20531.1 exodeoxyribonuclease VII large subunit [Gammaproteobacteria bacterium]NIX11125.1 exodeoxyribonuclease VII large subunit [Gammaproteobacteria bacterium]